MPSIGSRKRHRLFWLLAATSCLGLAGCASNSSSGSGGTRQYLGALDALAVHDQTRAVDLLHEAVRQNPDLIMAHVVLGDLYFDQNQTALAADQYQTLTTLDPYNADNYYKLGLSEQLLNRLKASIASYLKALELNPRDARSARNLGLVYLTLSRPREAADHLRQSIKLDPTNADGYANYGVALDMLGRYPEAEEAYRQALELGAAKGVTLLNLGANLVLQHRPGDAVDVLKEAVKASNTPLAHLQLGKALATDNKADEAINQFLLAMKLDANYYPAMNAAAEVSIRQYKAGLELDDSRRQAAVTMWRDSLKVKPDQPDVRRNLGRWNASGAIGEK